MRAVPIILYGVATLLVLVGLAFAAAIPSAWAEFDREYEDFVLAVFYAVLLPLLSFGVVMIGKRVADRNAGLDGANREPPPRA